MNENEREIKFRGMDLQGEWHIGNISKIEKDINSGGVKIKAGYYISNTVGMPFAYHCRPETISQDTGLLDRNKKPIFSNDIIAFNGIMRRPSVVIYSNGSYVLKGNYESCEHIFSFSEKCYEIVGNIFETPEKIQI